LRPEQAPPSGATVCFPTIMPSVGVAATPSRCATAARATARSTSRPACLQGSPQAMARRLAPKTRFTRCWRCCPRPPTPFDFAEDLEDVFPHVPLPSDHALFLAAAELGREIRAIETFARPPGAIFLTRAVARVETEATEALHASDWIDGELFLCATQTGRVSGIRAAIWSFSVSGAALAGRGKGSRSIMR